MEIKSMESRKHKKSTKIINATLGVLLLLYGLYAVLPYGVICGTLLLLAGMLNKSTILNEKGLLVVYDMKLYKYSELWDFKDITDIHIEKRPATKEAILHVNKDIMARRMVIKAEEASLTIAIAKSANKKIHIGKAYYSK